MRQPIFSLCTLVALAACSDPTVFEQRPDPVRQLVQTNLQDQPFDNGPVWVVSTEHGALHTYQLTRCQNDTRICGRHTGTLESTDDYAVVTGAYAGKTLYLSPGGDGWVKWNGALYPLAWDD
jgi:hypothetical protein